MANADLIDIELLCQLVDCDASTGELFWKFRPREMFSSEGPWVAWNKRMAGKQLYLNPHGKYTKVRICKKQYATHRVVWALVNKQWPSGHIDHINGDASDNRASNLRDVSHGENCRNLAMKRENKSGFMGVVRRGPSWRPYIWVDGKQKYLGSYKDFDEAVRIRRDAEIAYGFHPNHGRPRV
ncbi:MAG: HNH endonuclease [Sphingomonadales bacterium]|nr:HNH endonuclease [Sphingomonadales bacterium]